MTHIFGPVVSRRLGASLGLDIIPLKVCSFDCVYCECGPTTLKTAERRPYVTAEAVVSELKSYLKDHPGKLDYITFSGSGEPTLNSELGRMITEIRKLTPVPVAVLTNSSLIHRPDVVADLKLADLVVPSLDAVSDRNFRVIDRPLAGAGPGEIVEALVRFRDAYPGKIWLEILLIDGHNTSDEEALLFKKAVERIRPDRLQLNTVDRPPIFDWVRPAPRATLERVARIIGFAPVDIVVPKRPAEPA
jgi:wyosine [tRNA(Phe)-imidazoG37] synthetase (radical SAM superfamily)